jgi:hypothetical protein
MLNSISDKRSDGVTVVADDQKHGRLGRSLNLCHIVTPCSTMMLVIRQTCETEGVALKF